MYVREILSVFKNVKHLKMESWSYPFSLESLLSLIKGSKIKKVEIFCGPWLEKSSLNDMAKKYEQEKFKMHPVEYGQLTISYIE